MPVHDTRVDAMTPDQAKRPSIIDGIPDEDTGDEDDRTPGDAIASERTRKRRAIALVVIMLLAITGVIFLWL